jgi:tRNA threonylcarbamoyladenosine biosynthesis protein TsaB
MATPPPDNTPPDQTPLILALDTSSSQPSMALARQDQFLAGLVVQSSATRSERVWGQADLLLKEAGLSIADIDLYAVCTGPGGFTGIRVGMASAKGFASAARRPLIGVSALEATAMGAAVTSPSHSELRVCALIKAYRGDVYSQLFRIDSNGFPTELNEPMISTMASALERVCGLDNLVLVGDPARESFDLIRDSIRTRSGNIGAVGLSSRRPGEGDDENNAEASTGSGSSVRPQVNPSNWLIVGSPRLLAADVARLAYQKYLDGQAQTPGEVRASYVRASEAEIKLSLGLVGPGLGGRPADPEVAK